MVYLCYASAKPNIAIHNYITESQKCVDVRPEGQIGAGVSQRGGVAAQLLVLCRGHEAQQTKSDNVSHPHPVRLLKQPWQPVKREQKKKLGLNVTQPAVAS